MNFTRDDLTLIITAIAQLIASAQRLQNSKRSTPMIAEVYQKHELTLKALEAKAIEIREKIKP